MQKHNPLIVILGPTASGKSKLAVSLAKKFDGEIISADSRQVYKGLDIGTGKVTKKEMGGITHHLLNISKPGSSFSIDRYKKLAERALKQINGRNRLAFLVGGTGFYIDAVARGRNYAEVPPDKMLRKRLANVSLHELFAILAKLDPKRSRSVDRSNPRRLIRAIEVAKNPNEFEASEDRKIKAIFIGINRAPDVLRRRILSAVKVRLKRGLISETKKLLKTIPKKKLRALGLDYSVIIDFLGGKILKHELEKKLETAIWHYAKRQRTWFKRYSDIHWVKNQREAERLIRSFLGRSQRSKKASP